MVRTAEVLIGVRDKTGHTALEILDIACEPYRDCDAEFDGETSIDCPFGKLILEGFNADGALPIAGDDDADANERYDKVYSQFSDRYGFC